MQGKSGSACDCDTIGATAANIPINQLGSSLALIQIYFPRLQAFKVLFFVWTCSPRVFARSIVKLCQRHNRPWKHFRLRDDHTLIFFCFREKNTQLSGQLCLWQCLFSRPTRSGLYWKLVLYADHLYLCFQSRYQRNIALHLCAKSFYNTVPIPYPSLGEWSTYLETTFSIQCLIFINVSFS